jgi:hypothetical protein
MREAQLIVRPESDVQLIRIEPLALLETKEVRPKHSIVDPAIRYVTEAAIDDVFPDSTPTGRARDPQRLRRSLASEVDTVPPRLITQWECACLQSTNSRDHYDQIR